jgi:acetyltransferase-like isoleucine patch superfamily enzyme
MARGPGTDTWALLNLSLTQAMLELYREGTCLACHTARITSRPGGVVAQSPAFYFRSALCSAWFRLRGVKSSAIACEGRLPVLRTRGTVRIGWRFMVRCYTVPCEIGATNRKARLQIGARVFINQGASVLAAHSIKIGDDCLIGDYVAVLDTNWHSLDSASPIRSAPVVIGNNVWLCRGVTVLPGSKIGDHTVVAVGSVVKGTLPPRVLAAGNPAQVVRELQIADGWSRPDL